MTTTAKLKKHLDDATGHLLVARVAMRDGHHLVAQEALAKLSRVCNAAHEVAGQLQRKATSPLLPKKSDRGRG
jgi:hypothetical protein